MTDTDPMTKALIEVFEKDRINNMIFAARNYEVKSWKEIEKMEVDKCCVLFPWVQALTWKKQSALMSSFRGPDVSGQEKVKLVTKWIRHSCQGDADPTTIYMRVNFLELPTVIDFCEELQFSTGHFIDHLMTGLAIMAENHPEKTIRRYASNYVREFYLNHLHVSMRIDWVARGEE